MRVTTLLTTALTVLVAWTASGAAQEPKDAIEKAVKAHGGADRLAMYKAAQSRTLGLVNLMGTDVSYTSNAYMQLPAQMRNEMEVEIKGQRVTAVEVLNGDKAWLRTMGETRDLTGSILAEMLESAYAARVQSLLPLQQEKDFTLTALGTSKVGGKDAVGVKVASAGHKDISLYFDKENSLLVKSARRSVDANGREVFLESVFSNYKAVDGIQVPMKLTMYHDGKRFLDGVVTEMRHLEKVEDKQFEKP